MINFHIYFSLLTYLPTGTSSSVLKLNFVLKFYFVKHYFSPLKTFIRKEKDPDPHLWLIDPDPVPDPQHCITLKISCYVSNLNAELGQLHDDLEDTVGGQPAAHHGRQEAKGRRLLQRIKHVHQDIVQHLTQQLGRFVSWK